MKSLDTKKTIDRELAGISGFYPTPISLVKMMVERLGPVKNSDRVLEPSAGRGDIADYIRPLVKKLIVVEPHTTLSSLLRDKGYDPVICRFEYFSTGYQFDKVIMNPPFVDGLDMAHVRRAFSMLAGGGVLVALMNNSVSPGDGTPLQLEEFASWLIEEPSIDHYTVEPVAPHFLLSEENFRISQIPVKILTLHKKSEFTVNKYGI